MGPFDWIAFAVFSIIWIIGVIVNAQPHAQEWALLKLASEVGRDLPERLGQRLRARLVRSRRAALFGAMAGALLTIAALSLWPSHSLFGSLTILILASGIFAGVVVGTALSALRATKSPAHDEGVRVARAQAVTLNDYIGRFDQWTLRLPVVLAILAVLTVITLVQLGVARYTEIASITGAVALAAVAFGGLVTFDVVGRRVVAAGNRVGSAEELVWEDASRVSTLRSLAHTPIFLGYYTVFMSFSSPTIAAEPGYEAAFEILSLASVLFVILLAFGWLVAQYRSKRHFLRHLWPELAAPVSAAQPAKVE